MQGLRSISTHPASTANPRRAPAVVRNGPSRAPPGARGTIHPWLTSSTPSPLNHQPRPGCQRRDAAPQSTARAPCRIRATPGPPDAHLPQLDLRLRWGAGHAGEAEQRGGYTRTALGPQLNAGDYRSSWGVGCGRSGGAARLFGGRWGWRRVRFVAERREVRDGAQTTPRRLSGARLDRADAGHVRRRQVEEGPGLGL